MQAEAEAHELAHGANALLMVGSTPGPMDQLLQQMSEMQMNILETTTAVNRLQENQTSTKYKMPEHKTP